MELSELSRAQGSERTEATPQQPRGSSVAAERIHFADALRGMAAMWVVLFHMREGKHLESLGSALPKPVDELIFSAGHLGVAIFFVLSGFVMHFNSLERTFGVLQVVQFLGRRLVRLAPPYYFALLMTVGLLFLKARITQTPNPEVSALQILTHLTFTTGFLQLPFFNVVYWTLCIEIQFYFMFALLLWLSDAIAKRFSPSANVRSPLFLLSATIALFWPTGMTPYLGWPGSFIGFWYSFMAGVIIGHARSEWFKPFRNIYCFVFLLILLGCFLTRGDKFVLVTFLTASSLWLVQGLKVSRISNARWQGWAFLGMTSYSLYLLHNPITGVVFNVLRRTGYSGLLPEVLFSILALACCLFCSYLSALFIERPAIAWSRRMRQEP